LKGQGIDCPYFLSDDIATNDEPLPAAFTESDPEESATVERFFHSGEKLTVSEASRLLNERPAIVVFCAGGSRSGKTTFIARIGELFREGAFPDYRFARSRTLCAQERVTWQATITSEAHRPDTPRTFRGENDTFFHFRVHSREDGLCDLDVLISDLAGETFPIAIGSKDFCSGLCALQRADHIVVFLDSAQLAEPAKRQAERNNAREFLQRVIAVKEDSAKLQVHVAFSRWDYITRSVNREDHERFCETIQQDFQNRFGTLFARLMFFRLAARPLDGQPTNDVVRAIFNEWISVPTQPATADAIRVIQPARDFSAFGLA